MSFQSISGIRFNDFFGLNGDYRIHNATLKLETDQMHYSIEVDGIGELNFVYEKLPDGHPYESNMNPYFIKEFNGIDISHMNIIFATDLDLNNNRVVSKYLDNNEHLNIYFVGTLTQIDDDTVHKISTGFTGTAVSDRGDYDLFIAGYFSKELPNGTHELTTVEIANQTTAIVAHNNNNGVNRNMNQSTIEGMTVTVSDGQAVSITIRGRVQTSGGTLDHYTCTITP